MVEPAITSILFFIGSGFQSLVHISDHILIQSPTINRHTRTHAWTVSGIPEGVQWTADEFLAENEHLIEAVGESMNRASA
jgi:hypothetical protein